MEEALALVLHDTLGTITRTIGSRDVEHIKTRI